MGRVAKFTSELVWYVPDIDDNRQDPDPFKVLIRPMTAAELEKHQRAMGSDTKNLYEVATRVNNEILRDCIVDVDGYVANVDGTEWRPKNGAELIDAIYSAGASELIILNDIIVAIRNESHLQEGALKKLLSSSDSSPTGATTSKASEGGDAQDADAKTQADQKATTIEASAYGRSGIVTTRTMPI